MFQVYLFCHNFVLISNKLRVYTFLDIVNFFFLFFFCEPHLICVISLSQTEEQRGLENKKKKKKKKEEEEGREA